MIKEKRPIIEISIRIERKFSILILIFLLFKIFLLIHFTLVIVSTYDKGESFLLETNTTLSIYESRFNDYEVKAEIQIQNFTASGGFGPCWILGDELIK